MPIINSPTRKRASAAVRRRKPSSSLWGKVEHYADTLAFSWSVRQGLYRHLSVQVKNTIPVEDALDSYRVRLQRRKRVSSDKIVSDVSRRMRNGATLSAALADWIPADEANIISSGELSGKLPQALVLLIDSKRRVASVNKAVKSAMMRPLIYALAVYAFVWSIASFVLPDLQYAVPRERAHGNVALLYVISDLATSWFAVVPGVLALIATCAIKYSLPRWGGRYRIAAERYFPYNFYRDIQGYAWLMGFTALLRAGMADVNILKKQSALASPWLRERLRAIGWRMDNGDSLAIALSSKGKGGMPAFDFPNPDIVDDITSMAGFADFPVRITEVASQWIEELQEEMERKATKFGYWAEGIMYGVVTFLLVVINDMTSQLSRAAG